MKIRKATQKDKNYLKKQDDLKESMIKKKIKLEEYLVAEKENKQIGFLRFGYFWSEVPIIEMVRINKNFQKQGIGQKLVEFLTNITKKSKQKVILSLSTGNEKGPQTWHKKIGFKKIGQIKDSKLTKNIPEVFFIKKLK
jgi:N-acetylglutamate synthase-like GNAT family acetyltransferase